MTHAYLYPRFGNTSQMFMAMNSSKKLNQFLGAVHYEELKNNQAHQPPDIKCSFTKKGLSRSSRHLPSSSIIGRHL